MACGPWHLVGCVTSNCLVICVAPDTGLCGLPCVSTIVTMMGQKAVELFTGKKDDQGVVDFMDKVSKALAGSSKIVNKMFNESKAEKPEAPAATLVGPIDTCPLFLKTALWSAEENEFNRLAFSMSMYTVSVYGTGPMNDKDGMQDALVSAFGNVPYSTCNTTECRRCGLKCFKHIYNNGDDQFGCPSNQKRHACCQSHVLQSDVVTFKTLT